jgi:hypothetical protein
MCRKAIREQSFPASHSELFATKNAPMLKKARVGLTSHAVILKEMKLEFLRLGIAQNSRFSEFKKFSSKILLANPVYTYQGLTTE